MRIRKRKQEKTRGRPSKEELEFQRVLSIKFDECLANLVNKSFTSK